MASAAGRPSSKAGGRHDRTGPDPRALSSVRDRRSRATVGPDQSGVRPPEPRPGPDPSGSHAAEPAAGRRPPARHRIWRWAPHRGRAAIPTGHQRGRHRPPRGPGLGGAGAGPRCNLRRRFRRRAAAGLRLRRRGVGDHALQLDLGPDDGERGRPRDHPRDAAGRVAGLVRPALRQPVERGGPRAVQGSAGSAVPGWEIELRSSTVIPPIARRLGRTTPVMYPVLHAIPPLRSHLIGRLRCPT